MFGVSHSFSYFVFLKSIGIGYLLGLVYLFFQTPRRFGFNHSLAVIIQDVLFCGVSSLIIFLLVYEVNAGIFRFYIFAGILMGFLLFRCFPGQAADRFAVQTVKKIKKRRKLLLRPKQKNPRNAK